MLRPKYARVNMVVALAVAFVKVEIIEKSGEGGVDNVGVLRMNLISFEVLSQCKRHTSAVLTLEVPCKSAITTDYLFKRYYYC